MLSICPICNEWKSLTMHHKFPQTKLNKKLYKEFIHHPKNIFYCCLGCHLNKPIPTWSEKEFCKALGIKTRSKSGLL
jgi:hypothetical protein